jgi:hypothetical protein
MTLGPSRHRRAALHLAAVAVLAGSGVLLTGGPGHAADVAKPDAYGGEATASGVYFDLDRNPQPTPVTDPFHANAAYASSSLDSSGSATAESAPAFPGEGILGVPALLCQAGACLPLPGYPLMARASYPTKVDSQAQASPAVPAVGPLAVTPNLTVAHADPDRVEATTKDSGLNLAGQVTVDSVTAHSKQAFEGGTLVVTSETTVKGIDLGGGQLHIDAVHSLAVARVDGGAVTTSSATTTVSGATAGGHPVTIGSSGISADGQGDGGQAFGAVDSALAQLDASGITVRLLTPTKSAGDGAATAATGGILISLDKVVQNPPPPPNPIHPLPNPNGEYLGTLAIGGAGVSAFAVPALAFGAPPVFVPQPQLPVAVARTGGNVVAPIQPVSSGATTSIPVGQAPPPPITQQSLRPRPAAVLGVDLTGERLRVLVLVLLGYPALVLLTGPIRARPRAGRT